MVFGVSSERIRWIMSGETRDTHDSTDVCRDALHGNSSYYSPRVCSQTFCPDSVSQLFSFSSDVPLAHSQFHLLRVGPHPKNYCVQCHPPSDSARGHLAQTDRMTLDRPLPAKTIPTTVVRASGTNPGQIKLVGERYHGVFNIIGC